MGNKNTSQIVGVGNVCMQTKTSCIMTLKNVSHVLDLWLNLLSTSALDKEGYEHYTVQDTWKLTKGSVVVNDIGFQDTLEIHKGQLNIVGDDASPKFCLKSLALMFEKGLQLLAKQYLILIVKGESLNPYEQYLQSIIEFHFRKTWNRGNIN